MVEALQSDAGFGFEGRLSGAGTWLPGCASEMDEVVLGKVVDLAALEAAAVSSDNAAMHVAPPMHDPSVPVPHDSGASESAVSRGSALAQITCEDLESHEWDMHPFDFMNLLMQAQAVAGVLESALPGAAELGRSVASFEEAPQSAHLLRLLCASKTNCHAITALTGDDDVGDGGGASAGGKGSRLDINAIGETSNRGAPGAVHVVRQRRVGVGIYPRAAMMNHSCEPNCLVRFTGRCGSVRYPAAIIALAPAPPPPLSLT